MILKESRKLFYRLGIEIMEGKISVVFHVRLKFPMQNPAPTFRS